MASILFSVYRMLSSKFTVDYLEKKTNETIPFLLISSLAVVDGYSSMASNEMFSFHMAFFFYSTSTNVVAVCSFSYG